MFFFFPFKKHNTISHHQIMSCRFCNDNSTKFYSGGQRKHNSEGFLQLTQNLSQEDQQNKTKNRLLTCSPFPLGSSLAGLLWLGLLHLFPSFLLIVAPSIFILFLSKVIVFVTAKVICWGAHEWTSVHRQFIFLRPASFSTRTNTLLLPAESFLDLESFSSDSSLQIDRGQSLLNWSDKERNIDLAHLLLFYIRSAAAADHGKGCAAAASKCHENHITTNPFTLSNMNAACRLSAAAGTEVRYNEHSVLCDQV